MYITAHRVRNASGETGVNSFLYQRESADVNRSDAAGDDGRANVGAEPFSLVRQNTHLPAGGNTVLGYVDVYAPASTPTRTIAIALSEFDNLLEQEEPPLKRSIEDVTINFSITIGMFGQERQLFGELREAILSLLENR